MKKAVCLLLSILISAALSHAAPLEKSLLGRWNLDENNGDAAADSSFIRNHAAKIVEGKWVDGVFGKAVEFNGTGFLETAMPGSVIPLESFTLDFYFKANNVQKYQYLFSGKGVPSPGVPGYGIFVRLAQGTFLECGISTPLGWQELRYFGTIEKGKWYRFTMIVEKAVKMANNTEKKLFRR